MRACVFATIGVLSPAASVDGRLLAPWYTALCRHIGVCEGVVVFAVRFDAGDDDDDDVVIGVASAALDWTSQVIGEAAAMTVLRDSRKFIQRRRR